MNKYALIKNNKKHFCVSHDEIIDFINMFGDIDDAYYKKYINKFYSYRNINILIYDKIIICINGLLWTWCSDDGGVAKKYKEDIIIFKEYLRLEKLKRILE